MHTEQLTDWSLSSDRKVNEDEPATQLSLTPVNTSHTEAVISAYNSPGLQNMWIETRCYGGADMRCQVLLSVESVPWFSGRVLWEDLYVFV